MVQTQLYNTVPEFELGVAPTGMARLDQNILCKPPCVVAPRIQFTQKVLAQSCHTVWCDWDYESSHTLWRN
jgi:hypothetical protein